MHRTLIVATTSYAGMGPYVSEIVNNFAPNDGVFYFFCDHEDDFFLKNIKENLHSKSVFFKSINSKINKIKGLLPIKRTYHDEIVRCCKEHNIQVVHFINNPAPIKIIKALEKMNISVVSTVHDLHAHESNKAWYKELRFKIIYAGLQRSLEYGKFFITNSKTQYKEIEKFYPQKKVYFHSFPSLVSKNIRKGRDVPIELQNCMMPYILFFGRIEAYKGISLLYDVFVSEADLHNKYSLVIAGSGDLPFVRRENEKNVIMINRYIRDSEVAALYKNARVVVYPYISVTQSGVLSIAFYFGLPVLTSDLDFFREDILASKAGLLFERGNKFDLKKKLEMLLNQKMVEFAESGKMYYMQHYDGDVIRRDLLDIYKDVYEQSKK